MNSDSAFYIGKTHHICEDYSTAGMGEETCYAVLADGCSGSLHTDIGARVLARVTAMRLMGPVLLSARMSDMVRFYEGIIKESAACVEALGLCQSALDATLLFIQSTKTHFVAACYGDGVVALGGPGGEIDAYAVHYRSGYPNYPNYLLHPERLEDHAEHNASGREIETWKLPGDIDVDGKITANDKPLQVFKGACADYRFAAILSDGVHSFTQVAATATSRTTTEVPPSRVISEVLGFKSYTGSFVQRRSQSFLRSCAAAGRHHNDDFAVAAVHFGE